MVDTAGERERKSVRVCVSDRGREREREGSRCLVVVYVILFIERTK